MRYTLVCLVLIFNSCLGFSQNKLEGTWVGNLNFGSTELPFVIHINKQDNGWKATADSPKQGVKGIPAQMTIKQDSIFIDIQGGIQVQGVQTNDSTLTTVFSQAGVKVPLILKRGAENLNEKHALKRPQTPIPPYGYDTVDVKFKNEFDKITLAGTLTSPRGNDKYPAVILLTGSGAQNRNEEIFGHQPFKVLADYLTKNGIVVLRYDDRGTGESEGVFETSTIEDFSKDAISAFNFLKEQRQVDVNKIGIIGHSEGGLIAQLLAAQAVPHLSFIATLAGPAISIDKLMVEQLYAIGKAQGMSETNLAAARKINEKNFQIVKSDLNETDAYQALRDNMKEVLGGRENEQTRRELLTMLAPAYRYFLRIEPERFLPQIHVPMFAAFGSLDVQVPANQNLKSLFDLLPKNSKTMLKEYPELNHLFQKAKTGSVSEYAQIEETFNEEVLEDLANWIKGL